MAALYSGFSTVNREKRTFSLYDIDLVKQDILNHLYTRKGERVMMPNWGTNIQDYVMEPFVDEVVDLIEDEVRQVIEQEPRVQLTNLNLIEQEHLIQISIELLYQPGDIADTLYAEFIRDDNTVS